MNAVAKKAGVARAATARKAAPAKAPAAKKAAAKREHRFINRGHWCC